MGIRTRTTTSLWAATADRAESAVTVAEAAMAGEMEMEAMAQLAAAKSGAAAALDMADLVDKARMPAMVEAAETGEREEQLPYRCLITALVRVTSTIEEAREVESVGVVSGEWAEMAAMSVIRGLGPLPAAKQRQAVILTFPALREQGAIPVIQAQQMGKTAQAVPHLISPIGSLPAGAAAATVIPARTCSAWEALSSSIRKERGSI